MLGGESSYGTPLMRTSEILQLQVVVVGGVLNWASVRINQCKFEELVSLWEQGLRKNLLL